MTQIKQKRLIAVWIAVVLIVTACVIPVHAAASVVLSAPQDFVLVGRTLQYTATCTPSGGTVTWSSSNTSIATVSSTGLVTALKAGTVTIVANYVAPDGSTGSMYDYLTVGTETGITSGSTYVIRNRYSGRYVALASRTDSDAVDIVGVTSKASSHQQWILNKQSDGRFYIASAYSTAGRILGVSGTDCYLYSQASYCRFSIYRIESGTYKGLYAICYGSYYLTMDSSYQVTLTTTLNARSAWSIMETAKSTAVVADHDSSYTGLITSGYTTEVLNRLNNMGYGKLNLRNKSAEESFDRLTSGISIYAFKGHGLPALIAFEGVFGNDLGAIVASDGLYNGGTTYKIDSMDVNSLSSLRCVLYLGCETGMSLEGSNLVQATYDKGAACVIGTLGTISEESADDFLNYFTTRCASGYNINSAIAYAIDEIAEFEVQNENGTYIVDEFPVYTVGDIYQVLS